MNGLLLAALIAAAPNAELLDKLAAHDARSDDADQRGTVTVTSTSEELDSDGKVLHTDVLVARTTHLAGKEATEVLSALKDGADVTAAAREKMKTNDSKGDDLELGSPFAAKARSKYTFTELGPDKADPVLVRIGWAPKEKSSSVSIGEASVDPAAGAPVRMQLRPA